MMTSFTELTYDNARYIVLKELDTQGSFGQLLIQAQPKLFESVLSVCNAIEAAEDDTKGKNTVDICSDELFNILYNITVRLPSFMLLDLEHPNSNDFVSGWVIILDKYITLQQSILNDLTYEPDSWSPEMVHSYLENLSQSLTAIFRLIQLGLSYTDLLTTSEAVVAELRTWRNARPTSLKMSEAYLQALNFNLEGKE